MDTCHTMVVAFKMRPQCESGHKDYLRVVKSTEGVHGGSTNSRRRELKSSSISGPTLKERQRYIEELVQEFIEQDDKRRAKDGTGGFSGKTSKSSGSAGSSSSSSSGSTASGSEYLYYMQI